MDNIIINLCNHYCFTLEQFKTKNVEFDLTKILKQIVR